MGLGWFFNKAQHWNPARPTLVLRRPYCFNVFIFPEVLVWPPTPPPPPLLTVTAYLDTSSVFWLFREHILLSAYPKSWFFHKHSLKWMRHLQEDEFRQLQLSWQVDRAPPASRPDWMWSAYSAMLFHLKINPRHLQWRWLIVRSGWDKSPHGVFFLYSGLCTVTADCKHWTEEISSSVEDLIVDWYFCCCQTFTLCWMGPSMMCTFYEGNIYLKCN